MKKNKKNVCCICGEEYSGFGNNARPLREGRCCDCCNQMYVIPYRFMQMLADKKKNSVSEY